MSPRSASYRRAKPPKGKQSTIPRELAAELKALENVTDEEIDMTGMPEYLNWTSAEIGKYYRPRKIPVSLRIDADVLVWFKSSGDGYQSRMNEALRLYARVQQRSQSKPTIRKKKSRKTA
jgi:uncharacterized protein (DUF4415 family)